MYIGPVSPLFTFTIFDKRHSVAQVLHQMSERCVVIEECGAYSRAALIRIGRRLTARRIFK